MQSWGRTATRPQPWSTHVPARRQARSAVVVTITSNKLKEVARELPEQVGRAIDKTLLEMESDVKRGMGAAGSPSAPGDYPGMDTGTLASSIQTDRKGTKGVMYTNMEYAPFLEYGTSRMAARPFFTPAARVGKTTLDEEVERLAKQIGK